MDCGPVASSNMITLFHLFEMQNPRTYLDFQILQFNKISRWFICTLKFEKYWLNTSIIVALQACGQAVNVSDL